MSPGCGQYTSLLGVFTDAKEFISDHAQTPSINDAVLSEVQQTGNVLKG